MPAWQAVNIEYLPDGPYGRAIFFTSMACLVGAMNEGMGLRIAGCACLGFCAGYSSGFMVHWLCIQNPSLTGRYDDLFVHPDDNELPYFLDMEGDEMDAFEKLYRDVLVLQKMLTAYRMPQNGTMGGQTHADA